MTGKSRRTRRRWSEEFKRRVVCEAARPGVSVASVARRYDLNDNLVFNWKRRYGVAPSFLPVEVSASSSPGPFTEGSVEIALANGTRVRVSGVFDADGVARLVRGLSP